MKTNLKDKDKTRERTPEERISELESRIEGSSRYEQLVKNLTMLGAVCAFAWGLYEHFDTKQMEFRKAFWEKQYALYTRATQAAGPIP